MTNILLWGIVIGLLLVCLLLWFHRVRQVMQERQEAVEVATEQVARFRKNAIEMQNDSRCIDVLVRSENIYRQAIGLYQAALENPFNWLPATLMGFRPIVEGDDSFQR